MFFTLLSHLPEPALVIVSVALLILTVDSLVLVTSVLLSDVACERVIRLIIALSQLMGKNVQPVKQRHNRRK